MTNLYKNPLNTTVMYQNFESLYFYSFRRNDNAEFFYHLERLPEYVTRRFQSNSDERVGRCLHVFHLCITVRICLCQLCGEEAAVA